MSSCQSSGVRTGVCTAWQPSTDVVVQMLLYSSVVVPCAVLDFEFQLGTLVYCHISLSIPMLPLNSFSV